MKDAFEEFISSGGAVNVCVGIDLEGTSYEALTSLLLVTSSLSIVHSESEQTYHPKIFNFVGLKQGLLIVGSHNLTAGGLWTNFESSAIVHTGENASGALFSNQSILDYQKRLKALGDSYMEVRTQGEVDRLLKDGYVVKEVAQRVSRGREHKRRGGGARLFGKGCPAGLPGVVKPTGVEKVKVLKSAPAAGGLRSLLKPSDEDDQTIWFETRAMTGGSRNILDLSSKSLLERGEVRGSPLELEDARFIRGGVEFFGIDPSDVDHEKKFTINFEGVDYEGNLILYPKGDKANGTWRMQIKGVDASGKKITEALSEKGQGYLQYKIAAFTRVRDDYFYLSVFPDAEMEDFKEVSRILARNGSTKSAKLIGLF